MRDDPESVNGRLIHCWSCWHAYNTGKMRLLENYKCRLITFIHNHNLCGCTNTLHTWKVAFLNKYKKHLNWHILLWKSPLDYLFRYWKIKTSNKINTLTLLLFIGRNLRNCLELLRLVTVFWKQVNNFPTHYIVYILLDRSILAENSSLFCWYLFSQHTMTAVSSTNSH